VTYATDTDSTEHRVGFYVAFEGIEARLATHDMAAVGLSGTYHECIIPGTLTGGESRLDFLRHVVQPAGLSFTVSDSADVRGMIVRRGTEDELSEEVTASATTIKTVGGSFSSGDTVYVGRETITLGTLSGTQYTGSTRGAHGSNADEHREGATVSTAPRHWLGRRATLCAVNLDTGTEDAVATFVLSASPKYSDGVWAFAGVSASTDLNRPVLSGWTEQVATGSADTGQIIAADGSYIQTFSFYVPDARHLMGGANDNGACRVTVDDKVGFFVLRNNGVNTGSNLISIAPADWIGGDRIDAHDAERADRIAVRQVLYCFGAAARVAAELILSVEGDGTQSYDVHPGRAPDDTDEQGWLRGGAGIPEAYVDVDSWGGVGYDDVRFIVDESRPLFDVLRDEILWKAGGCADVDADGKLTFRKYKPVTVVDGLDTYDTGDDVILTTVDSVDDESNAMGRAVFRCNYDPARRTFERTIVVDWPEAQEIYGLGAGAEVEVSSRALWTGEGALRGKVQVTSAELRSYLERLRYRSTEGGRMRRIRLPWRYHVGMYPGARFNLTHAYAPDHEGAIGFTAVPHEVVSVRTDYGALALDVLCEEMPTAQLIAPAVSAASYNLGTIAIDTGGTDADYFPGTPGQYFPVGCTVRIYDADASPPFSSSQTTTVDAAAANSIQIDTNGLSFAPANGDLVVLEHGADATAAVANGANVQDYAFLAEGGNVISGGEAYEQAAARWQ